MSIFRRWWDSYVRKHLTTAPQLPQAQPKGLCEPLTLEEHYQAGIDRAREWKEDIRISNLHRLHQLETSQNFIGEVGIDHKGRSWFRRNKI